MSDFLSLVNVRGGYGREAVIKNMSLTVNQGDFLGIIGPNGSGKSTLLRLMSSALPLDEGSVLCSGVQMGMLSRKEIARSIAFVSQETAIHFPFSVWEIVLMGRIAHLGRFQKESKKDIAVAEEALTLTDCILLKNKDIDKLSAGERQRVIIARALAQQPALLLLDEPLSHLDIGHQIQILDLLKDLNLNKKLTILMAIHDLNLASEYCNRIVLLNNGELFTKGSPQEVLTYQNIEAVYKTIVVVKTNPLTSKPYVVLVSQTNTWQPH